MNLKIIETVLREKHSLPEAFRFYRWEVLPANAQNGQYTHTQLSGSVVTKLIARGPRKGQPNWNACDKALDRTFIVSHDDGQVWEQEWSAKTGKCARCTGEGKVMKRIDFVANHVDYDSCPQCDGTGAHHAKIAVTA